MDFLRTLLQDIPRDRPSVVFDIGANKGGYTWLIRQHLPLATIEAFEPIPELYESTCQRYQQDLNVFVWKLGMSDHVYEETGLAVHEAWTIDKPERARRGRNATWGRETFGVVFSTVDTWVADGPSPSTRVDFLKIDTDGYEYRVLKGAEATILRDRPPILIELGYLVEDLGDSIDDFVDYIYHALRYRLYTQEGQRLDGDNHLDWYPFHTTFDVAMLPAEMPLRPLD